MSAVEFSVRGRPIPQPRPRFLVVSRPGRRAFGRSYTPDQKVGPWRQAVAVAARLAARGAVIDGACEVEIRFYMPRPQRLLRRTSPAQAIPYTAQRANDADNLAKAVLDAITDAGVWRDDGQVYDLRVVRMYHAIGASPGAVVRIKASPHD